MSGRIMSITSRLPLHRVRSTAMNGPSTTTHESVTIQATRPNLSYLDPPPATIIVWKAARRRVGLHRQRSGSIGLSITRSSMKEIASRKKEGL